MINAQVANKGGLLPRLDRRLKKKHSLKKNTQECLHSQPPPGSCHHGTKNSNQSAHSYPAQTIGGQSHEDPPAPSGGTGQEVECATGIDIKSTTWIKH